MNAKDHNPKCFKCKNQAVERDAGLLKSIPYLYCLTCKGEVDKWGYEVRPVAKGIGEEGIPATSPFKIDLPEGCLFDPRIFSSKIWEPSRRGPGLLDTQERIQIRKPPRDDLEFNGRRVQFESPALDHVEVVVQTLRDVVWQKRY